MVEERPLWIIWSMPNDRPALFAICSNQKSLDRYVTADRKSLLSGAPAFVEEVISDHAYGANDMRIAMAILRNTKDTK